MQFTKGHAIQTPWLHTDGKYIKDPYGNIVILRGVSLVDLGCIDHDVNRFRLKNARQLVDMATDSSNGWYARVIRLPVYPAAQNGEAGWNANRDDYFINHLDPTVQHCINKGVYCIIDLHYIADYQPTDRETRAFWTYIAPKYSDYPNVIYELFNEPAYPDDWNTWKNTAQPWVDLIRSFAPNNLILISGPRWAQNLSSAGANPFRGTNLAYVAHIYPEHGGQSVWDSWFGNAADFVPFFITEWGYRNGAPSPCSGTQAGYGDAWRSYIEGKGNISWTAWAFDNDWEPCMFAKHNPGWILLSGDDFMGQFVKDWLYLRRNDNLPGGSATPTPRPNSAPTPTPAVIAGPKAASSGLKVQYRCGDLSSGDNWIKPHFLIVNNSGSSIAMNALTIRYWYTRDTVQNQIFQVDYAACGNANVTGTFYPVIPARSGADYYCEIGFSAGAGSISANSYSGDIQVRFRKEDWSNYTETGDYSYDFTKTVYTDWSRVTLYQNGVLIWGVEP